MTLSKHNPHEGGIGGRVHPPTVKEVTSDLFFDSDFERFYITGYPQVGLDFVVIDISNHEWLNFGPTFSVQIGFEGSVRVRTATSQRPIYARMPEGINTNVRPFK